MVTRPLKTLKNWAKKWILVLIPTVEGWNPVAAQKWPEIKLCHPPTWGKCNRHAGSFWANWQPSPLLILFINAHPCFSAQTPSQGKLTSKQKWQYTNINWQHEHVPDIDSNKAASFKDPETSPKQCQSYHPSEDGQWETTLRWSSPHHRVPQLKRLVYHGNPKEHTRWTHKTGTDKKFWCFHVPRNIQGQIRVGEKMNLNPELENMFAELDIQNSLRLEQKVAKED